MTRVYIALGANLPSVAGPPEATLLAATERMAGLAGLGRLTGRSSLYRTSPVGLVAQPDFVNAVVELETAMEPRALLGALLAIEREFGRDRSPAAVANGPRTLDLDLLLYGEQRIDETNLTVPHPRIAARTFVLVPLRELDEEISLPPGGGKVAECLHRALQGANADDGRVEKIEFPGWIAGRLPRGRGHAGLHGPGAVEPGADG